MPNLTKIHYSKPSITNLEISYATDAATNGWGTKCYDYIYKFEQTFAQHIGVQYTHATSSGTGALHLGLAALGIGTGDEVILADINWVASVASVVHLGAIPVFVDILTDTWCLDPTKVEQAITSRTKAIIAVHLYGNLCAMAELERIAAKYNLVIIEDAAEAIGSYWGHHHAGSKGIFGIFSFHGTKTITTGEGGMLVTNDKSLYEKVNILNNHGRLKGDSRQFWASEIGYKYKMSNIQAAIGCAQMERIAELVARKREIFFMYKNILKKHSEITMNPEKIGEIYGYWMPTIVFSKESNIQQEQILKLFQQNNIDGRAFFAPLSMQAKFKSQFNNINAYTIYSRAINLPSYFEIETFEIERVTKIIDNLLR